MNKNDFHNDAITISQKRKYRQVDDIFRLAPPEVAKWQQFILGERFL